MGALSPDLPPREEHESPHLAIERTIRSYEAVLDCHICIHDQSGSFSTPAGERLLLPSRIIHQATVCRHHHTQRCLDHCAAAVHEESLRRGAYRHVCWKGVSELVIPIKRGPTQLACLYAGVLRAEQTEQRLPNSVQQIRAQLPEQHQFTDEVMTDMLHCLGAYLLRQLDKIQGDEGIEIDDRRSLIARWLRTHASEAVGLEDLAQQLSLSKSRCSHLVQECFGESFRSLLLHERLERARLLLINNPWQSIRVIAQRSGFGDERHFSRMFRQRFHEAPGRYRRQYQSRA